MKRHFRSDYLFIQMSYYFCVIFRTPVKSQGKCFESQDNLCNLVSKKEKVYPSNRIKENKYRYI